MEKNIKEFDYQAVVVKKDNLETVIQNYASFGWQVDEQINSNQFDNLVEIQMSRPHKIDGKDNLQYLQVNLESKLNRQGRLERNKHSASLIWGLSLFVIVAISVAASVVFATKFKAPLSIVLCVVCACVAAIMMVFSIFFTKRIFKREILKYNTTTEKNKAEIQKICKQAEDILIGG